MPGIRACACAYLSSVNQASVLCMHVQVCFKSFSIDYYISFLPAWVAAKVCTNRKIQLHTQY